MIFNSDINDHKVHKVNELSTMSQDRLIKTLVALWAILDDIDTASDIAKGNDMLYRKIVGKHHQRRWKETDITTDGYSLYIKKNLSWSDTE